VVWGRKTPGYPIGRSANAKMSREHRKSESMRLFGFLFELHYFSRYILSYIGHQAIDHAG
jgi:hypothetical protein